MAQFSLKTLLLAMVGISVFCGVAFAAPIWVFALLMTFVVTLSVPALLCGIVYFRGKAQAFAIGAAAPTAFVLGALISRDAPVLDFVGEVAASTQGWFAPGEYLKCIWLFYLWLVLLSGATGVAIRQLARRFPALRNDTDRSIERAAPTAIRSGRGED